MRARSGASSSASTRGCAGASRDGCRHASWWAAGAAAGWGRVMRGGGRVALVLLDDWERVDPVSRAAIRRAALHRESVTRWVWARRAHAANADEDRVLLAAGHALELALGALD